MAGGEIQLVSSARQTALGFSPIRPAIGWGGAGRQTVETVDAWGAWNWTPKTG